MMIEKIKEKMQQVFLICHDEWAPLLWMLFLNFILSAGTIIALSVSSALMLSRVGAADIPRVLILSAAVMFPYFILLNHFERRVSRRNLLILSYVLYAALLAYSRYMMIQSPDDDGLLFIIYVFTVCILLLENLQYWSFANLIFHPRQGKRLFPLLGIGGALGAILVGFSMDFLVKQFGGVPNLLFLWAGIFFIAAITVLLMYKFVGIKEQLESNDESTFYQNLIGDIQIINRVPILKTVAAIIFILTFISIVLYFEFNYVIGKSFPIESDLALVVGQFCGVLNLAILFFQIFITGRVVSKLGLVRTFFLHPLILFIPVLLIPIYKVSYIPIVAALFVDILLLKTFYQTASESVYGTVPAWMREQAMSFMKIVATPLSMGVSGIVLMALFNLFPGTFSKLIGIILPLLFLFWFIAVWRLKSLYIKTLFGNFINADKDQQLETYKALAQIPQTDTLRIIRRALKLGDVGSKKFALELIGEMSLKVLVDETLEFLDSDEEVLKVEAISALGKIGDEKVYPRLMKVYKGASRETKLLLLKNMKMVAAKNFNINAPLLVQEEEEEPVIQGFLLENIWMGWELSPTQEDILKKISRSSEAEARIAAARCLSYDKRGNFTDVLISLLKDKDRKVQKAAAISASNIKAQGAIPVLMKLLESSRRDIADLAMKALINIKVDAVKVVKESVSLKESGEVLKLKLRIMAQIGGDKEREFLLSNFVGISPEILLPPLEDLASKEMDYHELSRLETEILEKMITKKVEICKRECLAVCSIRDILRQKKNHYEMLKILLTDRLDIHKKIILYCLHLLYPEGKILMIIKNIFSRDPRRKDIATEALENLLPLNFKNMVMPLFERVDIEDEIDYLCSQEKLNNHGLTLNLEILRDAGDEWLKAWSMLTAGAFKLKEWEDILEEEVESSNQLISEHARAGLLLLKAGI